MRPMIAIRDMTKVYHMGDIEVGALQGVSFDIMPGEFVAIIGPSGSGKSTLMNMIGCLDVPTAGSYVLDGEEVASLVGDDLSLVRARKLICCLLPLTLLGCATRPDDAGAPPTSSVGAAVAARVGTAVTLGVGLWGTVAVATSAPPAAAPPCWPPIINPRATASPPATRARMIATIQGVAPPRELAGAARPPVGAVVAFATGVSAPCLITGCAMRAACATGLTLVVAPLTLGAGGAAMLAAGARAGGRPTDVASLAASRAWTNAPALGKRADTSLATARSSTGSRATGRPGATLLGVGGWR
ncbi:ATP-binding cassette domain-containing protein [Oscillochloris sp. ZM17-4]|nr:ATP-binding cassette domain-containing protein [Oscillochloris sp. ZM17-4]